MMILPALFFVCYGSSEPLPSQNIEAFFDSQPVEPYRYAGEISGADMPRIRGTLHEAAVTCAGDGLSSKFQSFLNAAIMGNASFLMSMKTALSRIKETIEALTNSPRTAIAAYLPEIVEYRDAAATYGKHAQAYWLLSIAAAPKSGEKVNFVRVSKSFNGVDVPGYSKFMGPQLQKSPIDSTIALMETVASGLESVAENSWIIRFMRKNRKALNLTEETGLLERFLKVYPVSNEAEPEKDESYLLTEHDIEFWKALEVWKTKVETELERRRNSSGVSHVAVGEHTPQHVANLELDG